MILPSWSAASHPSASCPSGTAQVVFRHLNRLLTVWTKIDRLCSRLCHVGCHTTCVWLFTPPRLPSCSLNIDSLPCWLLALLTSGLTKNTWNNAILFFPPPHISFAKRHFIFCTFFFQEAVAVDVVCSVPTGISSLWLLQQQLNVSMRWRGESSHDPLTVLCGSRQWLIHACRCPFCMAVVHWLELRTPTCLVLFRPEN